MSTRAWSAHSPSNLLVEITAAILLYLPTEQFASSPSAAAPECFQLVGRRSRSHPFATVSILDNRPQVRRREAVGRVGFLAWVRTMPTMRTVGPPVSITIVALTSIMATDYGPIFGSFVFRGYQPLLQPQIVAAGFFDAGRIDNGGGFGRNSGEKFGRVARWSGGRLAQPSHLFKIAHRFLAEYRGRADTTTPERP